MRVVMTGAAGGIGTMLRPMLGEVEEVDWVLSDLEVPGDAQDGERWVAADMESASDMARLLEGCDAVINFGGISRENTAELIHRVNVIGTYNLYEAARKAGVRRIMFASSNHAIGFHKREDRLDSTAEILPDSMYGVSKVYGEGLAKLYWKKFGIEGALVRIGSCFEKPRDRRMMATWMSPGDMLRLIERVLKVPRLGCPVVYGVSANDEQWWDNSRAAYLGWTPQDTSADFGTLFPDVPAEDPDDPAILYHGGGFAKAGHYED